MQIIVKGKNMDVGESLHSHIEEVLGDITGKYFASPLEAHVTFGQERHLVRADVSVHVSHNMLLQASAEADDAYQAFDQAAEKLGRRLQRHKQRIKDHHQKMPVSGMKAAAFILESNDESVEERNEPIVVAEMESEIGTMTVSDAVMRLELGEMQALMFHNSAHGGLNMVYRRADGNIGWVDPTGNKAS
ncbi:MAG: ribosomal subunit interface protein [Alphaproteobacteria bacterium GWF2_58_20]|nr:MAG: ribosomal subunit interface protein [Alphaproteobacteria bacterium GWF2_58_20]